MNNKSLVLLRTLLKATSQFNIFKHTKDNKKKKQIIGNIIGFNILFLVLMAYCIMSCVGYGVMGIIQVVPTMTAVMISAVAFIFTLLKTNGYLFNFKEYDMLMSLPFEAKTVAADKFLYMYIKSLPWFLSISVAMMIGYGTYAKPLFVVYPLWIILSFVLPVIPMLIAAFIGFLIAKVSSGFKKTHMIQTVLMMGIIILSICSRFIIEKIFKNGQVEDTLTSISDAMEGVGHVFWPVNWFSKAITELSIGNMLLLVGVSLCCFEVVFILMGRSYQKLNSLFKTHGASKKYKMRAQKKSSVVNAIAFKEYKRLTGSSTYMTNAIVGNIMAVVLGVVALVVGIDRVMAVVLADAPISANILYPSFPLIVYFFIGMVPTTACSPSLEGKNYWIVQSLPIEKKALYQGKMLFQMYLSVPCMLIATLCLCISAKVPVYSTLLYLVEGIVLCGFSTAWGCVCGVKFMRLDWENEVEVIKQGAAVSVYLLPNMFITMGVIVLVVVLGLKMNPNLVSLILTLIMAVLAVICYKKAVK